MTLRERLPSDVEKIFSEIKSVPKDMKDRREVQYVLLSVELHDMSVERDVYRWIATQYCEALNKDVAALKGASWEALVDGEAKHLYEMQKNRIAEQINAEIKE